MRITSIKQQVKNPDRVSVFLDGKYSFSLSLDELLQKRPKKDDELSPEEVKKLKKLSADGKLRGRALEWLLNRPHSERELRDYLFRKKADPALIRELEKEFVKKQYLDDRKYAEWLIDVRIRAGKSNRAIRSELFKKGVSREVAEELLETETNDEEERLKMMIAKKRKLARYQKDPHKLAQYLGHQGFSWSDIKQNLNSDINT